MVVSEITLFNVLREKFGEQTAQSVIEGIRSSVKTEFENQKDILASKELVKDEIHRLEIKIEKSDIQTSIYIVGLIQYLAILGSLVALIKFVMN